MTTSRSRGDSPRTEDLRPIGACQACLMALPLGVALYLVFGGCAAVIVEAARG